VSSRTFPHFQRLKTVSDDDKDRRALAVCWGIFDMDGNWRPNPYLQMPADEQRSQNVAAGFMTEDGNRIPLPPNVDWWQN
jgi:hypothetical protein